MGVCILFDHRTDTEHRLHSLGCVIADRVPLQHAFTGNLLLGGTLAVQEHLSFDLKQGMLALDK